MTDNRTTELQSLSKLKRAGRLRYWRGTIEMPETELCEKGDMAMARATDELRKSLDFMRIWISEDAHLGESAISRELEKAEGLRKLDAIEQAIAATLGSEFNPDGLPVGLTISDDSNLLNWRGENYVKQSTLGSGNADTDDALALLDEIRELLEIV